MFGLSPVPTARSRYGRTVRRSLPLEKGQLRDVVKSGRYPIHAYQHDPPSQSARSCPDPTRPPIGQRHRCSTLGAQAPWICGRVLRTGARPAGRVDSPWTTRGRVAHRPPTLARLSPTTPPRRQQVFSFRRGGGWESSLRGLTGQNISALFFEAASPKEIERRAKREFASPMSK